MLIAARVGVIRKTVCRRIVIGHLMMSIANRFGGVLLEHHLQNIAVRVATERILVYLDSLETAVDEVTEV
jgi:hypothetical protein